MVHIYAKPNAEVMRKRRREIITAEIRILRKYEDRSLIEERINREMCKLHELWFSPRSSVST